MSEKPILFSSAMIRAILENRKSQTRRVVKPQPKAISEFWPKGSHVEWQDIVKKQEYYFECGYCPYGKTGDRLWVKETWQPYEMEGGQDGILYRADDGFREIPNTKAAAELWVKARNNRDGWRSPRYIPRWASRITLEITGIRVDRVQEISEEDAKSEGSSPTLKRVDSARLGAIGTFVEGYQQIWDSINGKNYPWESNPWVWVIEFKRL